MNNALCDRCGRLVPARQTERAGRVYLAKDCPGCGSTETPISSDAARYAAKRALDTGHAHRECGLNCLECDHKKEPTLIFVDVTNRCNLNCPICINNTPSMGFVFDPPIEYFDKIFRHFSAQEPRPPIQLFGGEPTMREDIFEIIALARSYHLSVRIVTNGLKLADEEYCRKLLKRRVTVLLAYDGANAEMYRVLRGGAKILALKQKALDNVCAIEGGKIALMTCIAKGFNDNEMTELLDLCHKRREHVRGIYFMPLAHTWDRAVLDLDPDRMSAEEIEQLINNCFPGERVDFIPAGILGEIPTLIGLFGIRNPPFSGAHPNCESVYVLVSNGSRYVPLARYLKGSPPDVIRSLFGVEQRLVRAGRAMDRSVAGRILARLGLRKRCLWLLALFLLVGRGRRYVKIGAVLKGEGGLGKAAHAALALVELLLLRRGGDVVRRHTNISGTLQLIVLPFEDNSVLETERLMRCPNAFAYVDPGDDRVATIPVCVWSRHKKKIMREIADHYAANPVHGERSR